MTQSNFMEGHKTTPIHKPTMKPDWMEAEGPPTMKRGKYLGLKGKSVNISQQLFHGQLQGEIQELLLD